MAMKLLEIISRTLLSDNLEISAEDIQYYKQNPEDLDLIIDKVNFNRLFFILLFLLGIIITVISKLLEFYYADYLPLFVKEVLLNILSEIGIAVFGGAIIAYLIEFHRNKQYQRNLKYRNKIKAILEKETEKS